MAKAQAVATIDPSRSLVAKVAARYSVDPDKMLSTLKSTAFKVRDRQITNEQMMALLVVADQYKLNPFTKEIYAFPDRDGIVPVVGVDGWARIINEHPQFDGMDFEQDDESCTCVIYRKDRAHPIRVTEYMEECARDTPAWRSHPKRMLRHKAMIQCARIAFSFVGFYDPDEAERIIDVTPERPAKPARKGRQTSLSEITDVEPEPEPAQAREPGSDDDAGEDSAEQ